MFRNELERTIGARKRKNKDGSLTRRKALSRLGLVAFAAYTGPALTSLSMAHAASSESAASAASVASKASVASQASVASTLSAASGPSSSTPSSVAEKACGKEDLNDPNYIAYLNDNGIHLP